jgi:hypothetical protein
MLLTVLVVAVLAVFCHMMGSGFKGWVGRLRVRNRIRQQCR